MLSSMIIFTDMQPMLTLLMTQSYHHLKLWLDKHEDVFPSIHCGMLFWALMPTLPLTKTISGLQMICSCSPLSQDHGSSGITFLLVLLPTWVLPFHSHTVQFWFAWTYTAISSWHHGLQIPWFLLFCPKLEKLPFLLPQWFWMGRWFLRLVSDFPTSNSLLMLQLRQSCFKLAVPSLQSPTHMHTQFYLSSYLWVNTHKWSS